jgi:putative membrane protein
MKLQSMMTITMAGAALLLSASLGLAQYNRTDTQGQRGQLAEKDYRFLEKAARGGMEEVQLGELAKQKGVNEAVRSFGDRMVTDHGKANDELKKLAAQKGATWPTVMSHGGQSAIDKLQKATGTDFDKTYAKDMAKDHRTDVKEFQNAAKDLTDPDLRAWAQKTLPVLEQHLGMAENMETTVKNEK